jgi:pantoate--beta-alanine ligase
MGVAARAGAFVSAGIPCYDSIAGLRSTTETAWRTGRSIGLVPTMGALHEGHLSLVRRARAENDVVVVSVFVNPTQFGPSEDLDRYPRDLRHDRELAEGAGADVVFAPATGEIYAEGHATWVEVEGLTEGLCGSSRAGHFRGVCTVVAKLFNICRPDRAYFGEKDAQQLAVIEKMARELDFRVGIVPCPTVREPDGLALSSRNVRLSSAERAQAPALYKALATARTLVESGERDAGNLRREMLSVLAGADLAVVDYVEIVNAQSLVPVAALAGRCLLAVAVWFGTTRLIDNVTVTIR